MKNKHIKVNANSDFRKYRIGVVRDDAGEQLVSTKLHVDKSKLMVGVNAAPNIRMLTSGRIDLFAYDENVARWTIMKENLNHDDFETVLTLEEGKHYIAFNKEVSDVVINKFQRALNELKASGEYNKIMQKYLKSY
jgi:ABC-type amino acid transport substrate-binding protein